MRVILIGALIALAGCAATSTVAPLGGDTFMLSKQAATGFHGLGNLTAEVLTEANAHCVKLGRGMQVVSTSESQPPYLFGNYPRAEVRFTCR